MADSFGRCKCCAMYDRSDAITECATLPRDIPIWWRWICPDCRDGLAHSEIEASIRTNIARMGGLGYDAPGAAYADSPNARQFDAAKYAAQFRIKSILEARGRLGTRYRTV